MMNRRWFFTAAGSACLAAACATVRGGATEPEPCPPDPVPSDPEKKWESLLAHFFRGLLLERCEIVNKVPELPAAKFPDQRPGLEAIFTGKLITMYRDRFDWRMEKNELPDTVYNEALNQACVLGQLTGLAFQYDTGVTGDPDEFAFERAHPGGDLHPRHLDWARDMYGFYTNPDVPKRNHPKIILCGERIQIDKPCPFCQP